MTANRTFLYTALREGFSEGQLDWDDCHRDDTGDGVRVITGADIDRTRLIHPFVQDLANRLRAHNQTAGGRTTIRVRIAMHAGDVFMSDGRVTGTSLEFLARMIEAPPLRGALARAPESVTVALAVSEYVYENVVRHGYLGIDPASYGRSSFAVKETASSMWIHLPGYGRPQMDTGVATSRSSGEVASPTAFGDPEVKTTGFAVRADNVNIATGASHVGEQVGRIGTRIDHVTGSVQFGHPSQSTANVRQMVDELRLSLIDCRRSGMVDEATFTEAESELRIADSHASDTDPEGRSKLLLALRKFKGLVDGVADLAVKVAAVITAIRSR